MEGKKLNLVGRVFLAIAALAGVVKASTGRLDIQNYIGPSNTSGVHKTFHWPGALEGYDVEDLIYNSNHGPGINSKIISKLPGYELQMDSRPLDSNTPINLELSLHSESGDPIIINSNNKLRCELDQTDKGWDFGNKPITIQQQDLSDLNKDGNVDFYDYAILANDYGKTGNALAGDISGADAISDGKGDFYDLAYFGKGWLNKRVYPVYDIRRTINAQGGDVGVIPISGLDGTYISEKPCANFQLRFDRFLADLDDNGRVNFKSDYAILANDWGKGPGQYIGDISGPNGIPDGYVNNFDLGAFHDDWLADVNDPTTW